VLHALHCSPLQAHAGQCWSRLAAYAGDWQLSNWPAHTRSNAWRTPPRAATLLHRCPLLRLPLHTSAIPLPSAFATSLCWRWPTQHCPNWRDTRILIREHTHVRGGGCLFCRSTQQRTSSGTSKNAMLSTSGSCCSPRKTVHTKLASHRIASHRIASHSIASHRIASHRIASHRIASHRIASRVQ
jgi:hypothetical protein